MVKVMRITSCTRVKIRQFGGDSFSQQHCPCLAAQRHGRCICSWLVACVDGRAISGWKIGSVKQVFDAEGQSMKQSTNRSRIKLLRPFEGGMTVDVDEGVNQWLALFNTFKARG